MTKKTIGACIMVHNMAPLIGACVQSLQWVDAIYVFDDLSTDGSAQIAKSRSTVPLIVVRSKAGNVAFEHGELETRNSILRHAFQELNVDAMVIIDADKLVSSHLKKQIDSLLDDDVADSIAFTTWHLYDERRYLHFWERTINGVAMIDPHTRVVKRIRRFTPLFPDGSHPIIEATPSTQCYNSPYHFHLKYFHKSTFPNYSLYFLPERPRVRDITPYLRDLPFSLPEDILSALSSIDWERMPKNAETPHHAIRRETFSDPRQALLHPKFSSHGRT